MHMSLAFSAIQYHDYSNYINQFLIAVAVFTL